MKPAPSFFVVGLFLAQLAAACPVAAASTSDEATTPEAQQAHRHFSLGVKLYSEGDFGPALAQFQRAYALKPHFRVLYNIAQCKFELRDYVEARATLRRYLAEGGAAALDAERNAQIEADLADLGRRIAQLDVHSNVRGAVVYVDGRKVGTTPLSQAIDVSEGQRSLSVESSTRGTKQRSVLLVGGDRQTITVDFELIAPGVGASSDLQESRSRGFLPSPASSLGAGFWVSGVGAALLAGGAGVTGYLALRAQNERRADLDRPGVSAAELDSDKRRIQTFAMTSDALLGGAIICAGVATTLLVLHGTEKRPTLALGPGSVALRGSF
jgi:hypothetical protein